jgi:murein DD-endopeptidase MepM/ murein hydrolase activator NlpD
MSQFWFRFAGIVFSLVLLVTLGVRGVPAVVAEATPGPGAAVHYTPLLPAVLSPPRWFRGADEQVHLVYELLVTNAAAVPLELTAVEVLDGDSGATVATLTGEALTAVTSLLISPNTPTTSLPAGTVGVVWFDLPLPEPAQIPATIAHRLTVTAPPGLPVGPTLTETAGRATVDRRPPVVLGPPLAGARWVAVGSCCDGPHRRGLMPVNGALHLGQRYAIDFNRLDAENRLSAGDPTRNTSAPSYGQPVLAVADATVVAAVDQYPDQIPGAPTGVAPEAPEGNHVILDLGEGRYALYAHLIPGSLTVQAGERVRQGQVIGELGNSGNSTGPHLHFQVMDAPSNLVADGLPYVFADFELTGTVPPLAELLVLDRTQEPAPIDTHGAGPRHDALPLGRDMVTFPPPDA